MRDAELADGDTGRPSPAGIIERAFKFTHKAVTHILIDELLGSCHVVVRRLPVRGALGELRLHVPFLRPRAPDARGFDRREDPRGDPALQQLRECAVFVVASSKNGPPQVEEEGLARLDGQVRLVPPGCTPLLARNLGVHDAGLRERALLGLGRQALAQFLHRPVFRNDLVKLEAELLEHVLRRRRRAAPVGGAGQAPPVGRLGPGARSRSGLRHPAGVADIRDDISVAHAIVRARALEALGEGLLELQAAPPDELAELSDGAGPPVGQDGERVPKAVRERGFRRAPFGIDDVGREGAHLADAERLVRRGHPQARPEVREDAVALRQERRDLGGEGLGKLGRVQRRCGRPEVPPRVATHERLVGEGVLADPAQLA